MIALKVARLNLKINLGFILAWLFPLWSIVILYATSYKNYYPELADRQILVGGMKTNLGVRAMYGEVYEPGTLGQLVAWEGAGWLVLLASVFAVLLFGRCYRGSERSSLGELSRATGIKQVDVAKGALLLVIGVAAALGLGLMATFTVLEQVYGEFTTSGSLAFSACVPITMIASAVLAALLSLLSNDSTPSRLGLLAIGVGFMVRASADIERSDALRWLSPLGWPGIVRPFTDDNFWVLGIGCPATIAGAALWLALEGRREYGVGLLPARTRTARPPRAITSPWRLRQILDRPLLLTWLGTGFVLATFMNSLSASMEDLLNQDEKTGQIFKQMFTETDHQIAFITYLADFLGIMMAVAVVTSVLKLRAEERARTVDLMRSRGTRRTLPMALQAGSATLFIAGLCLATALGALLGVKVAADTWRVALTANLAQVAPMLALAGLAALIVGAMSKFSWLAWVPVIYSAVITIIGPLFKAPQWLLETSAFGHTIYQGNTDELSAWLALLIVGAIALAGGVALAGRRQVL